MSKTWWTYTGVWCLIFFVWSGFTLVFASMVAIEYVPVGLVFPLIVIIFWNWGDKKWQS